MTIPRWGSKREAKAFAERERPWIDKQLARVAAEGASSTEEMPVDEARELRARARRELPAQVAGVGGASQRHGVARQHQESALALGILFSERAHLPELAAPADAGLGPRLRAHPRVDAPEADGSFAGILEAGGRSLSCVSSGAAVPAATAPLSVGTPGRLRASTDSAGEARCPGMVAGTSLATVSGCAKYSSARRWSCFARPFQRASVCRMRRP